MKNIKGYYNWIHSLKIAAIDSYTKGQEMLQEQKKKAGSSQERSGYIPSALQHVEKGFRAEGDPIAPHPKDSPSETAHQIQAKILARKIAMGNQREFTGARGDVKPAGDANDVERDAEDGEMGNEGGLDTRIVDPSLVARNVYDLAAQARAEDHEEEPSPRFIEVARPDGKIGYESMDESINSKIKRIVMEMQGDEPVRENEPRSQRGSFTPGPASEIVRPPMSGIPEEIQRQLPGHKRNDLGAAIRQALENTENPEAHPIHVKVSHEFLNMIGQLYNQK